jgi:hypothetical protein
MKDWSDESALGSTCTRRIDAPNIKVMRSSCTVIFYNGRIWIWIDTRDLDVLGVKVCMGSGGVEKAEN